MNRRIIFAGLKARPVRTAVSVLAVALEVTLILSITGLVAGMISGSARHVSEVGADLMLLAPGASNLVQTSDAVMPETMAVNLAKLEHVSAVSPVIVVSNLGKTVGESVGKNVSKSVGKDAKRGITETVWGIEPATFDRITGGFLFLKGGIFASDNEAVVDDQFAKEHKLRFGDSFEMLNGTYRVSGIVAHGKGARIFMRLAALQEKKSVVSIDDTGKRVGKVSFFLIKLTNPDYFDDLERNLLDEETGVLKGYTVMNVHKYIEIFTNSLPFLDEFLDVVVSIAMCVGVLVIFLSTYTTITERTREIGVLRSLGASKGLIVSLVMEESLLICAVGAIVGTAASFGIARLVTMLYPTQSLEISIGWIVVAACVALISGILGSIYPAYKAARLDPIEALAYE